MRDFREEIERKLNDLGKELEISPTPEPLPIVAEGKAMARLKELDIEWCHMFAVVLEDNNHLEMDDPVYVKILDKLTAIRKEVLHLECVVKKLGGKPPLSARVDNEEDDY